MVPLVYRLRTCLCACCRSCLSFRRSRHCKSLHEADPVLLPRPRPQMISRVATTAPHRASVHNGAPMCFPNGALQQPSLRELLALAAFAAFGCGLALAQGDFLFAVVFCAASVVTIIEAIR